MTDEATELRTRAEHWRMMARAYEIHVQMVNSPTAQRAYERALQAAMDAEEALTSAAEALDDQLPLPLVRAVPIAVRAVSIGVDRVWVP